MNDQQICKNCKHWHKYNHMQCWGTCGMPLAPEGIGFVRATRCSMVTSEDFGCNRFVPSSILYSEEVGLMPDMNKLPKKSEDTKIGSKITAIEDIGDFLNAVWFYSDKQGILF